MAERLNSFDLKLLTSSKEVGLRRLRSYSASLGAGAQIFNTFDDLRRNVESVFTGHRLNIVLHDNTVPMNWAQMAELKRFARVFVLQKPDYKNRIEIPATTAPCWTAESYMQCSLAAFLESPVVRMSMAQMCKANQPFYLDQLLRWGHAASTWHAEPGQQKDALADASLAFVRGLNLTGEGRRLTEIFTHFIQARLSTMGLDKKSVTFGADGLLITVIARCAVQPDVEIRDLVQELRIHDFPISVVNTLGTGEIEIGALFYPFHMQSFRDERIVMAFHKALNEAASVDQKDDKLERAG